MESVLISIRPKWCVLIASGIKTYEIRKTKPKIAPPFKCYIYATAELGNVVGEFVCDYIESTYDNILSGKGNDHIKAGARMTGKEMDDYAQGAFLFAWHISNLVIYDEPRPLTNYHRPCPESLYCERCAMHNVHPVPHCGNYALEIRRPPQSWMYAEDQT